VYLLDEYTEELADKNQIIHQDSAFSLQYCKDLVAKVWENMY
jgi:poly-gamma-glutamate synthesis protein (capsule biosynthesis protein)